MRCECVSLQHAFLLLCVNFFVLTALFEGPGQCIILEQEDYELQLIKYNNKRKRQSAHDTNKLNRKIIFLLSANNYFIMPKAL